MENKKEQKGEVGRLEEVSGGKEWKVIDTVNRKRVVGGAGLKTTRKA